MCGCCAHSHCLRGSLCARQGRPSSEGAAGLCLAPGRFPTTPLWRADTAHESSQRLSPPTNHGPALQSPGGRGKFWQLRGEFLLGWGWGHKTEETNTKFLQASLFFIFIYIRK